MGLAVDEVCKSSDDYRTQTSGSKATGTFIYSIRSLTKNRLTLRP